MAVQPRVIFTRFSSVESLEFRPWLDHLARVLGSKAFPAVAVSDPTVWQLVSANNRELARSVELFDGFRSAHDAAAKSVGALPRAEIRPVVDERQGQYGWYLSTDGIPDVACSRWYLADRERNQSVSLAVAALAEAKMTEGARLVVERAQKGQVENVR
jgi:hypothetical protein